MSNYELNIPIGGLIGLLVLLAVCMPIILAFCRIVFAPCPLRKGFKLAGKGVVLDCGSNNQNEYLTLMGNRLFFDHSLSEKLPGPYKFIGRTLIWEETKRQKLIGE